MAQERGAGAQGHAALRMARSRSVDPPAGRRRGTRAPREARPRRAMTPEALGALVRGICAAAGVDPAQTESLADNLVWNDLAGRRNHGVERLPILIERAAKGLIACPCPAQVTRIAPAAARIDGANGFGQHLGRLGMDEAIALARGAGVGAVGVRDSNFYGTGAYFVNLAAEAGMIGLALSNAFPKVAAAGGHRPVLGTNPLAFGAPAPGGALLVDMSTAALAGSTLRAHVREGTPLPEGLAVDERGTPVTDPVAAAKATLLPAAGVKGFGLALLVEVLAGVLTGAGIGAGVGSLYRDFDRGGDSGHFFLAVDIGRWMDADAFAARMEDLRAQLEASGPDGAVRLPGAARWQTMAASRRDGLALAPATEAGLRDLATRYGVAWPG
ncbi:Ldh family oxidoreductase [Rhodobacteraceae bacterium CCMM004]|nr:Ldh family oxidoreductase [Rhodobacteraceae bacterium CCMM004]